jgi:hypothetical protein
MIEFRARLPKDEAALVIAAIRTARISRAATGQT